MENLLKKKLKIQRKTHLEKVNKDQQPDKEQYKINNNQLVVQ